MRSGLTASLSTSSLPTFSSAPSLSDHLTQILGMAVDTRLEEAFPHLVTQARLLLDTTTQPYPTFISRYRHRLSVNMIHLYNNSVQSQNSNLPQKKQESYLSHCQVSKCGLVPTPPNNFQGFVKVPKIIFLNKCVECHKIFYFQCFLNCSFCYQTRLISIPSLIRRQWNDTTVTR